MKKKVAIVVGVIVTLVIIAGIALSVYMSSESYRSKKASEPTDERIEICIDNTYYVNTDIEVPVEPDESAIEYVEIPVGGGSTIKAFARIHEDNEDYLVCLIGEDWYKFIAK